MQQVVLASERCDCRVSLRLRPDDCHGRAEKVTKLRVSDGAANCGADEVAIPIPRRMVVVSAGLVPQPACDRSHVSLEALVLPRLAFAVKINQEIRR